MFNNVRSQIVLFSAEEKNRLWAFQPRNHAKGMLCCAARLSGQWKPCCSITGLIRKAIVKNMSAGLQATLTSV